MNQSHTPGRILLLAMTALFGVNAQAATSINLGNYSVQNTYALDLDVGAVSGLEASAVTYARDRNSLFFVGDEGTGVIEISKTGTTLGSMTFDWAGTGSTKNDTEGLTYLGGGVLVVSEERLYDAYQFTYAANGSAALANSFVSISNATVGNNGLEGISYDARGAGSFVTVKQVSSEDILAGTLTFASGAGGTSTMTQLFDPALMGVASLSDVQTLSSVDALVGTAAADNLLVLSLDSRKLIEVNRAGTVLSSFDLSSILPSNGIEGVTIDENGTIYLVAEQDQTGSALPGAKSQLIVLAAAAPIPEADTYVFMALGMGLVGMLARRRKA
jgi:uncharacterized protein YjiK